MRAEDILFSFPFPVVITDRHGNIVTANQKFEILVNRSLRYIKGTKFSSFFSRSEEIDREIRRVSEELVEVLGFKDKEHFLNFAPFYASSQVAGVIIAVQPLACDPFGEDISSFLKGLSHEIRNPLGGIKGIAKLLKEMKSYDEELVSVLLTETERIQRFLDDVLKSFDFSNLAFERVNIHRLIQGVVKLFDAELREKSIDISYDFDPSLPEMFVDPDRITQALINLFKNAMDAVAESPERKIRIETGYAIHPAGFAYLRIKDSGKGMDEEEARKMFTPFYTTKKHGSGLGAFIASEIIKRHGGEIKVKSQKGRGTEITILLPMRRRDGKDPDSGR